MSLHTKGPWSAHCDADGCEIAISGPTRAGKIDIARLEIGFREFINNEQHANARLIAAAPDLLEALVPFVALCSSQETVTITVSTKDIQRARAAIAKAQP